MRAALLIPTIALSALWPAASSFAQAAGAPAAAARTSTAAQPAPAGSLPGEALPEGAELKTTESGLQYVVLHAGDEAHANEHPAPRDKVRVRYAGYLTDGTRFDASAEGLDATFGVKQVIPGWTEGLQLMSPGAGFKFVIPWKLAYGEVGRAPKIPAMADLVFDVELLEIIAAPPALPEPAFTLPPESELTTTASGLKYKVLRAGEGRKPLATDSVTVHYSGWLTDGTLFDSSYARSEPATFPVGGVIKGWTEGLQLMPTGSSYVFVIPAGLAYGKRGAGAGLIPPDATLVFEVELLKIDR